MAYIDGIPSRAHAIHMDASSILSLQEECSRQLHRLVPSDDYQRGISKMALTITDSEFYIGPFSILRSASSYKPPEFDLETDTALKNAMRVVRACQTTRPVLLEGSPGVGKTSLVAALASIAGCKFSRINLSDQTDLMDLFGHDLPKEG